MQAKISNISKHIDKNGQNGINRPSSTKPLEKSKTKNRDKEGDRSRRKNDINFQNRTKTVE